MNLLNKVSYEGTACGSSHARKKSIVTRVSMWYFFPYHFNFNILDDLFEFSKRGTDKHSEICMQVNVDLVQIFVIKWRIIS